MVNKLLSTFALSLCTVDKTVVACFITPAVSNYRPCALTALLPSSSLYSSSMSFFFFFFQVVLINAVRDVAKALAELIGATKCAAGKPADDPSMYQLKSAAKVMSGSMHVCTLTVWLSWMCAMRSLQAVCLGV